MLPWLLCILYRMKKRILIMVVIFYYLQGCNGKYSKGIAIYNCMATAVLSDVYRQDDTTG